MTYEDAMSRWSNSHTNLIWKNCSWRVLVHLDHWEVIRQELYKCSKTESMKKTPDRDDEEADKKFWKSCRRGI